MIIYILILQLAKKGIKFQLYYYNVISSMILINFTCVIKRKVKHDRCTHVKSSKKDSLRHRHNTVIDSEIEGSSALN